MINSFKAGVAAVAMTAAMGTAADATIVTVFDGIAAGRATFDSTIVGAGGVVENSVLTGLSSGATVDAGDFTISNNDGATVFFTTYGTMSGQVVGIDPAGGGSNPRTDPLDYFASGFTLTFADAVNAVGFEVGDWATCCFNPVTELFISFDGGAPILVGSATSSADGTFPSQANPQSNVTEIFVSAIDDTGTFTQVSFWGNGIGEYLVAGGDIRYSAIDVGSLPPTGQVPLPASGLLLLGGLGGVAALRRKARK